MKQGWRDPPRPTRSIRRRFSSGAGDKTNDRIATQPVYALASSKVFAENTKLNDRIFVPASEPRQGPESVQGSVAGAPDRGAASLETVVASPERDAVSHVVVSRGDTLYSIARRNGVKLSELILSTISAHPPVCASVSGCRFPNANWTQRRGLLRIPSSFPILRHHGIQGKPL